MSNPIRRGTWSRDEDNPKVVRFKTQKGRKVRAPRPGTLVNRKGGLAIITKRGSVHRLRGVKPREHMIGTKVIDGKWVGETTQSRPYYAAWGPKPKGGKRAQLSAARMVQAPLVVPPPTHMKPWSGSYPVPVGWRYSSGNAHRAWDVGMWTGTRLVAPFNMYIAGRNDGVQNNRPGYNPGSNSPSNWVLGWGYDPRGNKVTVYFQHMSPGLRVRKGQTVKCGTLLGYSGNTGNSSGPHLHIHVMKGWVSDRYLIYRDVGVAVYGPNKAWE